MKTMKKLASLFLALAMVLSLGVTAMASENPEFNGEAADNLDSGFTGPTGDVEVNVPDTFDPGFNAGDATQVTIKLPVDETGLRTYAIYQIFTGDVNEGEDTLSNVRWGLNGAGYDAGKNPQDKVADDLLKALAALQGSTSDTDILNAIKEMKENGLGNYVNLDSTPYKTATGNSEPVPVAPGYYMIVETTAQEVLNANNLTASLYMLQIAGDTTIKAKSGSTMVEKWILEENAEGDEEDGNKDGKVKSNDVAIGDEVDYEITATLPENYKEFTKFYLKFTDTLSGGLTYKKGTMKITANGDDVTDNFNVEYDPDITNPTVEYEPGTPLKITIVPNNDNMDLKTAVKGLSGNDKIVVTYTATLNEKANVGDGPDGANPNTVNLTYSNDPNKDWTGDPEEPDEPGGDPKIPTGKTPDDTVYTYVTEVEIFKVEETGEGVYSYTEALKGAEFTLKGDELNITLVAQERFTESEAGTYYKLKDGTYTTDAPDNNDDYYDSTTKKYVKETVLETKSDENTTEVTGVVDEKSGVVRFTGLKAGHYTLTESKTPDGYNTIEPIEFDVTFVPDAKDPSKGTFTISGNGFVVKDGKFSIQIENRAGSLLPETGGIGTTIFTVCGGVLMLGAAILLVTKKRSTTGE